MNTGKGYAKIGFLVLLLIAFVTAGCGHNNNAAPSSAKAITAYSLNGVTGVINETAKTISVTMPYGTNVTGLVATYVTTGTSVKVGTVTQTSAALPSNNFTNPVIYKVTAADGTSVNYTVTVTVASSSAKAITAFSLNGVAGSINETAKTIAVTMPFGTSKVGLIATFQTTGASVKVGLVTQLSGTTSNDFTSAVVYTVTAADASTVDYTVTVTVALNSAKAITAYSFAVYTDATGTITGASSPFAIAVTVPYGTDLTTLAATFSTTGASVMVGGVTQASGVTTNDFSSSVTYIVTAANGTTASYVVTVTVAPNTAKVITAYSLAGQLTSTITGTTIAVTVSAGTDTSSMIATFTASAGASVTVSGVTQTSGVTANDFSSPVTYLVTAASGTTATYIVTVTEAAAGLAPVNLLTAGDFVILANSAVTYNGVAAAPAVTGDVGISPFFAASITGFGSFAVDATNDFATAAEVVSPGRIYAPDFTGGQLGSNGLTPAKMTAAQNDMVTAYNDAFNRTPGVGATNLNVGAGTLTGNNFAPGTYTWDAGTPGGNVNITGDITLTGSATDVWIFQISGALDMSSATNVFLGGTAMAKNIFWQVAGGVTLNTTAHMEGVILSATAITLNAGATANSRLLAQTAVTLGGTVTQPAP